MQRVMEDTNIKNRSNNTVKLLDVCMSERTSISGASSIEFNDFTAFSVNLHTVHKCASMCRGTAWSLLVDVLKLKACLQEFGNGGGQHLLGKPLVARRHTVGTETPRLTKARGLRHRPALVHDRRVRVHLDARGTT